MLSLYLTYDSDDKVSRVEEGRVVDVNGSPPWKLSSGELKMAEERLSYIQYTYI
jgi:hypothetical protein